MPGQLDTNFYFNTAAVGEDVLRVVDFEGREEISTLFRFEVNLICDDPELELEGIVGQPAWLGLERDDELYKIHGIVSEFEQREKGPVHYHYRAVLVPRLWLLTQRFQSRVFAREPGALTSWKDGLTVDQIIEQVLKDAGLASDDYEIKLEEDHPYHEYVVQYRETDFDFISRLMEHEGIFYYFAHDDDKDKLIIADKNERFEPIEGEDELVYRDPTGMADLDRESVHGLICKQSHRPKEVMLKDYNWRTPSLDLTVKESVDDDGAGMICEYGDHYKETGKEGALLVRLRAEEMRCRQKLFVGRGNGVAFRAGYLFNLADHFRQEFDQEYLLLSVHHSGSQSSAGVGGTGQSEQRLAYENEFTSIPAEVPFRPQRVTPRPKISGTMNAKVDVSGSGEFAEIDDYGRYKVALPFDQKFDITGLAKGAGSRWIRLAQPFSGADYGMHFPLHKGTEVILVHIDGDPDRPVIVGTVPNAETHAPVDAEDSRKNVIRSAAGNLLEMDDTPGQEGFLMTNRNMGAVRQMRARPRKTE